MLKYFLFFFKLILPQSFPGEPKSVYVRNLPSNVREAEIEEEFKNFGQIIPDGIFIRFRKVSFFTDFI